MLINEHDLGMSIWVVMDSLSLACWSAKSQKWTWLSDRTRTGNHLDARLSSKVPMQYCYFFKMLTPPVLKSSPTEHYFYYSVSSFFLNLFSPILIIGIGTSLIWEFFTQCYMFAFSYCSRQEYWKIVAIPFSIGPRFVRTLHQVLSDWSGPTLTVSFVS